MNQDWERFGEDIRRTVQEAIDSQDFNRLNQTITNTVNSAMNSAVDGLEKGLSGIGKWTGKGRYRHWEPENIREAGGRQYSAVQQTPVVQKNSGLFVKTSRAKAGSIAMSVVGYTVGIGTFLMLLITLFGTALADVYFGTGFKVLTGILAVLFAGSMVLGGTGTALLGRIKRFRSYIQELEGKEYCEIKELAERLQKPQKYVVRDIEKMMRKGWFLQGHLDRQKTCLIVSNNAYKQYTELMQNIEKQKMEEKLAKEQQIREQRHMDPQVREIVRAGDEYIQKIRECNDAIPGKEISAKIYRIEILVNKIFDRVEQNPESISDIRRLMEYYLPTTVKLLEAYEELDAQPVQGENIISSKKEIEKTLDTLNVAFEKLLDGLFKDTAWNVSADISVLNTILAQEGLTKDDF
ncbi:5-bromo-4-chloroindolyl phosphate hydrolysis family protein [Clostridium sp. C105KSO13]|uniref:5-bromo-4-chloroindolyl phosphate hydrolysis family protein n=1 Tax=Clostridium sp. C105KSO13 TaxID=1776045 RepID=UPI0007405FA2|nr:5-bromo-4-chloroindolyl phosphate hydrolysis family protein [Clostridium sp. C105KSO13]CUX34834.1 5-bromo-4-chloroindolyl phosphate hydrolysis protein [Clostridium sp. C105KSO13]